MALSGCAAPAAEVDAAATAPETAASQPPTAGPSPSASVTPSPPVPAAGTPSREPSEAASEDPTEEPSAAPTESPMPVPTLTSAPPMAPAPSPPPAPGTCTAAQLSGSVQDQLGGGAAGSVHRTLRLTNTSEQTCTVEGYPGVSFVDAAGAQIGAPAAREDSAVVPLSVDPGSSVSAVLQQTNAQNYGEQCDLVPAAGLRVYPPGATDSIVLPQELPACSADSIVLMHVGPLQPAY